MSFCEPKIDECLQYLKLAHFSFPWALFTILDSLTLHSNLVYFHFCEIIIKNLVSVTIYVSIRTQVSVTIYCM